MITSSALLDFAGLLEVLARMEFLALIILGVMMTF